MANFSDILESQMKLEEYIIILEILLSQTELTIKLNRNKYNKCENIFIILTNIANTG